MVAVESKYLVALEEGVGLKMYLLATTQLLIYTFRRPQGSENNGNPRSFSLAEDDEGLRHGSHWSP